MKKIKKIIEKLFKKQCLFERLNAENKRKAKEMIDTCFGKIIRLDDGRVFTQTSIQDAYLIRKDFLKDFDNLISQNYSSCQIEIADAESYNLKINNKL